MATLIQVLKEEIAKVAKKEVKSQLKATAEQNKALKAEVSALKKRMATLEKGVPVRRGRGRPPKADKKVKEPNPLDRVRVTAKGIRSMRKKLRLTQEEMGHLLGVTGQSIWKMESSEGPLRIRNKTKEALVKARELNTHKEAVAMMATIPPRVPGPPRKRKKATADKKKPGKRGRPPKKK